MSKRFNFETKPFNYGGECCTGGCEGHELEMSVENSVLTITDTDDLESINIPTDQIQLLIDSLQEVQRRLI